MLIKCAFVGHKKNLMFSGIVYTIVTRVNSHNCDKFEFVLAIVAVRLVYIWKKRGITGTRSERNLTVLLADRVNRSWTFHADNMEEYERYLQEDLRRQTITYGQREKLDSYIEITKDVGRLLADAEVKTDLSLTLEKLEGRCIHADAIVVRRLLAYGRREAKRLFEGLREIWQLVTTLERLDGYLCVNVGEVKRLLADYIR
jgi:hypothetical protein